jgi:hypothetical protein
MPDYHSPSKKESTPSLTAKNALWDDAESTYPLDFPPEVILQAWLSSGKPRLVMKSENNSLLWVLLANFLMQSSVNTVWTVQVYYLPMQVAVITLTR